MKQTLCAETTLNCSKEIRNYLNRWWIDMAAVVRSANIEPTEDMILFSEERLIHPIIGVQMIEE